MQMPRCLEVRFLLVRAPRAQELAFCPRLPGGSDADPLPSLQVPYSLGTRHVVRYTWLALIAEALDTSRCCVDSPGRPGSESGRSPQAQPGLELWGAAQAQQALQGGWGRSGSVRRGGVGSSVLRPHPACLAPLVARPPPSLVLQVLVDGPETEAEAEEPPGGLHQVRHPGTLGVWPGEGWPRPAAWGPGWVSLTLCRPGQGRPCVLHHGGLQQLQELAQVGKLRLA